VLESIYGGTGLREQSTESRQRDRAAVYTQDADFDDMAGVAVVRV